MNIKKMSKEELESLSNKDITYYILEDRNDKKNMIWEYLNEPMESEDFIRISLIMNEYWRENK